MRSDGAPEVVLGIDVGGTSIKAGLIASDGTAVHRLDVRTDAARGRATVVSRIADAGHRLNAVATGRGLHVVGAGVAVPGVVDESGGIAVSAANLPWQNTPLAAELETAFAVPTTLGHDVRAGALAEGRLGAARGHRNFAFLAVGTGVGAALVLDGKPYAGDSRRAGEVGHLTGSGTGPACACGRLGCIESRASAAAIARRYAAASGDRARHAADVAAAVRKGDHSAVEIWQDAVSALAEAITTMTILLDVGLIVVGGGLAGAGELLFEPLRVAVAGMVRTAAGPAIVAATLGGDAGCIGAGLLALDRRRLAASSRS